MDRGDDVDRNKNPSPADVEPWFVTDAEIVQEFHRRGLTIRDAKIAVAALEKLPGWPFRDPIFGNRRYWPACKAFLDNRYGLNPVRPIKPDGKENWPSAKQKRPTNSLG